MSDPVIIAPDFDSAQQGDRQVHPPATLSAIHGELAAAAG